MRRGVTVMHITRSLLQRLVRPQLSTHALTQSCRSFHLSSSRMEEAVERLQQNPYYNKYADKIAKVAKERPAELVAAVSERRLTVAAEAADPLAAAAGVKRVSEQAAPQPKASMPRAACELAPQKKLDSIMKVALLKDKTAEEITHVWTEHWRQECGVLCGVMPAQLYGAVHATATRYDKFLFPLPREQGYEFMLAQFAAHEIHFTSLVNFQAHHENAPECLTMVHYTEFLDDHGLVLMRGDYDQNVLSGKEAQFLANQVNLFYSGQDKDKTALLHSFHDHPETFRHMDLVKHLEELDLSTLVTKPKLPNGVQDQTVEQQLRH